MGKLFEEHGPVIAVLISYFMLLCAVISALVVGNVGAAVGMLLCLLFPLVIFWKTITPRLIYSIGLLIKDLRSKKS